MTTHTAVAPLAPPLRAAQTSSHALAVDRERWIVAGIVLANLAQAAFFNWLYPAHRADPDLLAYFTYFRNWWDGDATLHTLAYFTAPKTLLVFTLGALGNATVALACSAAASALLGAVVYLLARDAFGRPAAIVASLFLLLDPSKAILTLKSSADLYLVLFVLLALLLAERHRLLASALCLLLATLVKPVALPCAAYFLVAPGSRARRVGALLIPFAALPLILLAHHALLGGALRGSQFFAEFASMTGGEPIHPGAVAHYALWSQLIKIRFAATAAWGIVGLLLWVADDESRLTHPLLWMPALFLAGYVVLSAIAPFPPYFRYFWLLEVWFLLFVASGTLEVARRVAPTEPRLRRAVVAVVLVLLADGLIGRQLDYRRDYAMPLEQSMRFADAAGGALKTHWRGGDTIVAPLGLLPYMVWELRDAARAGRIDTAERVARDRVAAQPTWIVDMPRLYVGDVTREWMRGVVGSGAYAVYLSDGQAALLHRTAARVDDGGSEQ